MQRESFQDDAVAQFLNAHFVSVKVDREMRPSLESALFAFSKASNGHAGWPLNVILTPSGYPLAGRTYQTKAEFLDLLTRLSAKWRLQASQLQKLAENAVPQWLPSTVVALEKPGVGTSLVKQFAVVAMDAGDTVSGGFGEQAKFPSYPQLNTLLTHFDVSQDAEVKEVITCGGPTSWRTRYQPSTMLRSTVTGPWTRPRRLQPGICHK